MVVDDLFFHELLLLGLRWLCVILYWMGQRRQAVTDQAQGNSAKRRHSQAPTPFPGLTSKPCCAACVHATQAHAALSPFAPPPLMISTRGRRHQVDTQQRFCPNPSCRYYGWVGLGNLRANGHPDAGPWRQWHCIACGSYFQETHGTLFHGKRVPAELIVRVVTSLAEGLGIRAVARVFEVDPNTVLAWLVERPTSSRLFPRICCTMSTSVGHRCKYRLMILVTLQSRRFVTNTTEQPVKDSCSKLTTMRTLPRLGMRTPA
jgi:hypothetical protein